MAQVLKVIIYPDVQLRSVSKPVTVFDARLKEFALDMTETMYASRGIGLAAIQVAVAQRIFVLDTQWRDEAEDQFEVKKRPRYFVNPELLEGEGDVLFEEGCLSIPKMYGDVMRREEIRVRYADLTGKVYEETLKDIDAIAFQHELDHLNGVLFFDHLSAFRRRTLLEKYLKMQTAKTKGEEE